MCGNMPSSQPVTNTTGNSSPLAVCSVIIVTTPAPCSGSSSASATSDTRSRNFASTPVSGMSSSAGSASPKRLGVGQVGAEFVCDADQFVEVVQPRQILWVARGFQLGAVAGAVEHRLDELAEFTVEAPAQIVDHLDETRDALLRAGVQHRHLALGGRLQRVVEDWRRCSRRTPPHTPRRGRRCRAAGCSGCAACSPSRRDCPAPAGRRRCRGSPCARKSERRQRLCTGCRPG